MRVIRANQYPHRRKLRDSVRLVFSFAPLVRLVKQPPQRPSGISVIVRVKNEVDWIGPSLLSIRELADEIIVADNGSTDGTIEVIESLRDEEGLPIQLYRKPELYHCDLSNFLLSKTRYCWIFRWDGDMVAHTTGNTSIKHLRDRILALDERRYWVIYLRLINLAGDLFHQDSREHVHIEDYICTYSDSLKFVQPGRFEAVLYPKYYRVLYWYEPYAFHVNVKPARRMLLRYFWEEWMEKKDYERFPTLGDYVQQHIESTFGTSCLDEAAKRCLKKACKFFVPYRPDIFGPYPELLKPFLKKPKYRLLVFQIFQCALISPADSSIPSDLYFLACLSLSDFILLNTAFSFSFHSSLSS